MSQVEPMTAAEYGVLTGLLTPGTSGRQVAERLLAALEERERLLGEQKANGAGRITADELDREADMATGPACGICAEYLRSAAFTIRHLESDASLGELLRRIREHPKNRDRPYPIRPFGCDSVFSIDAAGLTAFLRYLDSLLPKEPEVVTGPSGWQYKRSGNGDIITMISEKSGWTTGKGIPVEDAPVVAKLMAKGGSK